MISVPACTSIRNVSGPKTFDVSMIPDASHAPQFPLLPGTTSVGPPSADWSTLSTTVFAPVARSTRQTRAVVAFGSVEPAGNCCDEPGSSVTRSPPSVVSRLSGWWISSRVLTGASSPSTRIESERTFVGSFLSNTNFQIRPFDDVNGLLAGLVAPRPVSAT